MAEDIYLSPINNGSLLADFSEYSSRLVGASTVWECIDDPVGQYDNAITEVRIGNTSETFSVVFNIDDYNIKTINYLKLFERVYLSNTTSSYIKSGYYINSIFYEKTYIFSPRGSWFSFETSQTNLNPHTLLPWTINDLENLEVYVTLNSTRGASLKYSSITQLYLLINCDLQDELNGGISLVI